jgi:metal-dependent amidase/aminoacylase/carboxypeptidase family protein
MRIATINILRDIERKYGGSCELDWHVSTGPVHNDKNVALKLSLAISEADVKEVALPPRMSSEDFGWYLTKAPGMLFRFGTRNEEKGCTTVPHTADFKIDEYGMRYAIITFIEYAFRGKEK